MRPFQKHAAGLGVGTRVHMWSWWQKQTLWGIVGSPGVPGHSLQLAGSSLPSTQSLSLSQTQTRGIQRLVMEHWNWLGAQVTSAVG